MPLPERPAVVRPLRPLRALCRGRGQRRVARHGIRRKHAGEEPGLCEGARGAQQPDGAARQEPSLGDCLVAGQRGGHGAQFRGLLPLGEGVRRVASGAVRAGDRLQDGGRFALYGHCLPDVLGLRALPGVLRVESGQTAHPVRIRARHGELAGRVRPLLGPRAQIPRLPGRIHLGLRGPGAGALRAGRPRVVPLRRRLQRLRRDGQFVQLQRYRRARPHVASACPRGAAAVSVGVDRARRAGAGPCRGL